MIYVAVIEEFLEMMYLENVNVVKTLCVKENVERIGGRFIVCVSMYVEYSVLTATFYICNAPKIPWISFIAYLQGNTCKRIFRNTEILYIPRNIKSQSLF